MQVRLFSGLLSKFISYVCSLSKHYAVLFFSSILKLIWISEVLIFLMLLLIMLLPSI